MDQVLAVVTDAVAEGRLAFHPKDFYKSHKIQVGVRVQIQMLNNIESELR